MKQISLLQTIYNNEDDLLEKVQKFAEKGVDLSTVTEYCESPLRVASNNGRFEVVEFLIKSGADESQLDWMGLHYSVVYGTEEDIKKAISKNNDLEAKDFWSRTPFLLSILVGDIKKASLLIAMGTDKNVVGRCGKTPYDYAIQKNNVEMMDWLFKNGFDIEATDEFSSTPLINASEKGMTECVRYLIDHNADISKKNHIPESAIEVASNLDIVKMFVNRGLDINDINEEMHSLLIGTKLDTNLTVSMEIYLKGKYRKFGKTNPELNNEPFCLDMILSGANAWKAKSHFNDDTFNDSPIWCYERFGRSTTVLDDGKIIEIGGEHEDYYDPDFCIYNDVVVFSGLKEINIFTYPENVFPPTDFHTATLIGDLIYIIGGLGYYDSRIVGFTPVYTLNINSMKIERLSTKGEMPGWINCHKSFLSDDNCIVVFGGEILIDKSGEQDFIKNKQIFKLNLESLDWTI